MAPWTPRNTCQLCQLKQFIRTFSKNNSVITKGLNKKVQQQEGTTGFFLNDDKMAFISMPSRFSVRCVINPNALVNCKTECMTPGNGASLSVCQSFFSVQ